VKTESWSLAHVQMKARNCCICDTGKRMCTIWHVASPKQPASCSLLHIPWIKVFDPVSFTLGFVNRKSIW
jgi:hypothetical protein